MFVLLGTMEFFGGTGNCSYKQFYYSKTSVSSIFFSSISYARVDVLQKMLRLDPSKRITAPDALQHTYFSDVH